MNQREVTDSNNTTWTCVQAFAALQGKAGDKAEELSEDEQGFIPVVCTPNGGAQSVRLQLQKNWQEDMTDESLLQEISAAGA